MLKGLDQLVSGHEMTRIPSREDSEVRFTVMWLPGVVVIIALRINLLCIHVDHAYIHVMFILMTCPL